MASDFAKSNVRRIVSGGQTGVDRGALDAAIASNVEHGGWCPRGRLAADGVIPDHYRLTETESAEYPVRTEKNVVDSDGTLILYRGQLSGGTQLTHYLARKHAKPHLLVNLSSPQEAAEVCRWLTSNGIRVLNVAGPREGSEPGIAQQTQQLIEAILS